MAVRYTDFFEYDNWEYSLFIEGNKEESGKYEYKIQVISGDRIGTILCKNVNSDLEILPPDRPDWIKNVEGHLIGIIINLATINSHQQASRRGKGLSRQ